MTGTSTSPGQLRPNAVGIWSIVFFVIATNGPLTGLVGVVPTAIIMGNGIGLPSAFLLAGLVYLLFSVGFVAMGRYVRNAGAFYAYVSHGLGRPVGCAAAFLALAGYTGLQIACYGLIGFFAAESLNALQVITVQWWQVALGVTLLAHVAGRRNIAFNGKLLGGLMLAEMAIIALLDMAIVLMADKPSSGHALRRQHRADRLRHRHPAALRARRCRPDDTGAATGQRTSLHWRAGRTGTDLRCRGRLLRASQAPYLALAAPCRAIGIYCRPAHRTGDDHPAHGDAYRQFVTSPQRRHSLWDAAGRSGRAGRGLSPALAIP